MKKYTKKELESLWELFGDVPINDNDEIEEDFMFWDAGTDRFDIWKWFDEKYPGGVAALAYNFG